MELIIGGAFQGKTAYVKNMYPELQILDGQNADEESILSAACINSFHLFIRKCLQEDKDPGQITAKLSAENPKVILICDEVGYGVVPIDSFERKYREQVGRVMTELTKRAEKVTRVVCGIGTEIYHA